MIRMHKFSLAAALVGALAAFGCSSSSSSGSSGGSSFCLASNSGAAQICTGLSGLTADQKKSSDDACKQNGGTPVSSCPTDNQIGCCVNPQQGQHDATACYYQPTGDAGTMGGDAGPTYAQGCTQGGGTWKTP